MNIDKCQVLQESWVRETLSLNLKQIVEDIEEIRLIKALPQN